MRLERLEINGFKSFSDRSELAFDKGVTAIVGPNGCGKSNVADAITWVMGEQSAKSLRGDKMEDVIFNGSDARKPTATAEVRLRFSGFLKTVSGPAFPAGAAARGPRERKRPCERQRPRHGNGNGNGNGHHAGEGANGHERDDRRRGRHQRDHPVGCARGRGHAAAVPLGRERIPHRRRHLPPARRPRSADGHGARREELRDHRAGQDRDDPQHAPHRSASADRRGGRRDEVQGAPPRGRTQARSGAAEPHAHRRHRVRGREAARHAEAPGRQGETIPAAARRTAPLGEGALRPEVSPAGRDHRVGARAPCRRPRTRGRGGGPRQRSRIGSRPAAYRAGRSRVAVDAVAGGRPHLRAVDHAPRAADGLRSRAGADARRRARRTSPPNSRASKPGASRRAWRSRDAATPPPKPTWIATAPRRR